MSFDTQTKLAIYHHFAETGQRPSLEVIAERVRADVSSVREAYVRLRAQRVLVLEPDGVSIRMAPPFSGVPTQHVVIVDETKYFANCAWDSFGIPAALHRPRGGFIPAANNPVNCSIWRLAWKVRRPADGFFIASFPRPSGGTTLFSPEATCFSSGRKNGFGNGAPRIVIPCGRSSR
jgi:Alkylmercury lyase